MTVTQKQLYREFVEQHPELPVFYQDWWLTAACGADNWSAAIARDKDGQPGAIWPYHRYSRLYGLLKIITKPALTSLCGPWVAPSSPDKLSVTGQLSRHHRLLQDLLKQLPPALLTKATTPYDFDNAQPLIRDGWRIRRFYSYRLRSDRYTSDELWTRLSGKVRTALRKNLVTQQPIRPVKNPQTVIQLHFSHDDELSEEPRLKRVSKTYFSETQFLRLWWAGQSQQSTVCWAYYNKDEVPVAAIWLPYDNHSAYLSIAVSNPEKRKEQNAVSQLIWHAIQWCCERKLIFDFEGSYLPGVEEFYRSWGPEVKGYLELRKLGY